MPIASPCMKPKKVSTAPASANAAAFDELAVDDEDRDRAEDQAAEDRAAAEHLEPVVEHADLRRACRGRPRAALVPAAPSALSICSLAPGGEVRHEREDDRRRVAVRRFLEGLRADQHADVEQDRRDRDDRDERRASAR